MTGRIHARSVTLLIAVVFHHLIMNAYAASARELDIRQTVVVANQRVPESIELARYYMGVRGIPSNHLCVVDLPANDTISRWFYEQKLREPLQAFLREQKLIEQVKRDDANVGPNDNPWRTIKHHVRYVVSMYGIPLRIAESRPYLISKLAKLTEEPFRRDGAAVDSELACLLWESYPTMGYQPNPMYNVVYWTRNDRQIKPLLIAARLDGPDPASVRNMIDGAIKAEREGLHGRAYIDMRSIHDPDYLMGDHWMREAAERLRRAGYEILIDMPEGLFPANLPMDHAAFYLGWYAEYVQGPFLRNGFRFQPGAVAYHLHSASAKTLRSKNKYWAGPLIAAGASAVMGAVNEPYLAFTPDVQIFIDRLCAGYTFGESAYFSQRALSWQITVIGDPLYRPFSHTLMDGIRDLEQAGNPAVEWLHVQRMNQLIEQQQFNVAMEYGRNVLKKSGSLVVREKIADLYAKNDLWADAIREYERVLNEIEKEDQAMRIGHRLILLLRLLGREEDAVKVREHLVTKWPESRLLSYLDEAVP